MSEIPQPQYAAPNVPGGIPQTQTSTLAIVSLILGIASFVCSLLAGIPAIILGIIALSKIGKSNGRLQGGGLAIGGIVTGVIGCLLSVALLIPAVMAVRSAAKQVETQNNMRQIGLSFHNYEDAFKRLPSNIAKRDPEGGLSWRVHLLPFLGASNLYDSFHHDEPWDSPHNKTLISSMPKFYEHPKLQADLPEGHTVFQMPTSSPDDEPRAIHVKGERGLSFGDITDGSSNTILLVETDAQSAVPWTKPMDWHFDANNPKQNLGDTFARGTSMTMCDGSVTILDTESIPDENLRALFTPNGGEAVTLQNQ